MTARETLAYVRNHSGEVREVLLIQETLLSGIVNELLPVTDATKETIKDALGVAKGKIDSMIDTIDLLEEE